MVTEKPSEIQTSGFQAEAHPPIRSFVLRAGRLSPAQKRALDTLLPIYGIPFQNKYLDLDTVFERPAPIVFEIGFGMGNATSEIARRCPELNFIGVEVHAPGIGSLLNQIQTLGITNLKIIQHDAVEVLKHMIPPSSLYGVHLFFPDPWHKKRHHKRRIIQPDFVRLLVEHIVPGGYLHFATDWEPYAQWMIDILQKTTVLKNASPDNSFVSRPDYRPVTKFETRGLKLGHKVLDILFRKTSEP